MDERLFLLLAVVLAGVVGWVGFMIGDRRRRRDTGQSGPRPAPSIGEAIRLATARGQALILFLGDDEVSMTAGQDLAADPTVVAVLNREQFSHAVVRFDGEDRDIANALYEKYGGEPLPDEPMALLLDGAGERISAQPLAKKGRLARWIGTWVGDVPDLKRPGA